MTSTDIFPFPPGGGGVFSNIHIDPWIDHVISNSFTTHHHPITSGAICRTDRGDWRVAGTSQH
jgi:hypothetical protein